MALLGRLGAFLQRAVESEEDPVDLAAAFTQHWKGLTHYYLEATDESKPARETDIPWHLKQMLDILVFEEKQQASAGETGPCLEFLLQHKVLETLGTLGRAEYPPGMRAQVLLFFSRLLGQMQCPLLHYLNVHRPVQRLLQLGSDSLGPDPEKEAMQLVAVLCAKIRQDPSLLPCVLEDNGVAEPCHLQPSVAEADLGSPKEGASGAPPAEPSSFAQNLVASLVSLCKSQKRRIALKAQENLLLLSSADHPTAGLALTRDGRLSALVTDQLLALHSALPDALSPANIAPFQPVSWRCQSSPAEEENAFPGQADLEAFLGWLDLCDCLVKEAHPVVADAVREAVVQRLFVGRLQPQLLQMDERGLLLTTALLTLLVRQVRAPALLRELTVFLLGGEEDPETQQQQHQSLLRSQLIGRCNHLSDEISMGTLRLFEELLRLPEPLVLQTLVLGSLEGRGYVLRSLPGQEEPVAREPEPPCEDGLDLEEDPYFMDGLPSSSFPASAKAKTTAVSAPKPRTQPGERRDVKEVVSSFLCLVPSEAKTSTYLEEAGYDTYVHDASLLFKECSANAARWNWPRAPRPLESCPEGPGFYEGDFLKVLLDRLARILDQPYAVNLQVTSVISRLALFPHPHLHEYLLDPYLPMAPGCRTLFSVLIRVIGDLMQRTQRIPDFPAHLLQVRRQLMGLVPQDSRIAHRMLLEGVVILEEFCRELAAIVFVKSVPEEGPA
ncbi:FHF complex subunit HOOK-interacting protein 2B isoform X1 [Anolis carolinensis]|uniref:FHF complex subunit HOOK-interacting protein 2B isoform X1 n=1 Tax=Anolis carolinensis TaxID=28377 RepID=UPI002F2B5DC4